MPFPGVQAAAGDAIYVHLLPVALWPGLGARYVSHTVAAAGAQPENVSHPWPDRADSLPAPRFALQPAALQDWVCKLG